MEQSLYGIRLVYLIDKKLTFCVLNTNVGVIKFNYSVVLLRTKMADTSLKACAVSKQMHTLGTSYVIEFIN